jgi:GNAT superfamily N-acetyltransferase
MNIRLLQQNDAPAWRELRIRMLRDHATAFGQHVDDFLKLGDAEVLSWMLDGRVHGAFVDNELVGAAGWHTQRGAKRVHIGVIWGMYVSPHARGKGVGAALMDALMAVMREGGCSIAQLGVAETNAFARQLYESKGFEVWGREIDAMIVDGQPVTELHMWRRLD